MVTIAESLATLYPVNTEMPIALKGFVNGNWGNFNRDWFLASSGNIIPGMGLIHATGAAGENTVTEWGAATELGFGIAGWDKTQVTRASALIHNAYTAADLIPVYPISQNMGMIFQGHCSDTNGNWDADKQLMAAAVGTFATADLATKVYAQNLYYVVDTAEADQLLVMYLSQGSGG
jgi:hypothetical protein